MIIIGRSHFFIFFYYFHGLYHLEKETITHYHVGFRLSEIGAKVRKGG